MVQGRYYPLRLEYFQSTGRYELRLQWLWQGQSISSIPASNLCSGEP